MKYEIDVEALIVENAKLKEEIERLKTPVQISYTDTPVGIDIDPGFARCWKPMNK